MCGDQATEAEQVHVLIEVGQELLLRRYELWDGCGSPSLCQCCLVLRYHSSIDLTANVVNIQVILDPRLVMLMPPFVKPAHIWIQVSIEVDIREIIGLTSANHPLRHR